MVRRPPLNERPAFVDVDGLGNLSIAQRDFVCRVITESTEAAGRAYRDLYSRADSIDAGSVAKALAAMANVLERLDARLTRLETAAAVNDAANPPIDFDPDDGAPRLAAEA